MKWQARIRKASKVAGILTGLLALCVITAALSAYNQGYRAMVMQTDSMAPKLNRGDVVFVHPVQPERVRVGDVISFTAPMGSQRLVTHRVVEVVKTPNGPAFTTRGDNNPSPDPWQVQYLEDGWMYAFTVPYAGQALLVAQGPYGNLLGLAIMLPVGMIILWPAFAPRSVDPHESEQVMQW
jgi:signal peptidase I